MYDAVADPYCYPGTTVLKNVPGLTSQEDLDRFEAVASARRFLEPMPTGRWTVTHFLAVHRHIFHDVYPWAGRPRTIRMSRGTSMFCYPEHIQSELKRVFGWLRQSDYLVGRDPEAFARDAAHFLAELNAIHTFRDGNGRAQLAFLSLLGITAGHTLDLRQLDPGAFLQAMIVSFRGEEAPLSRQILLLTDRQL